MLKKLTVGLLIMAMFALLLTGCGSESTSNGNQGSEEKVKVALITSTGGLGDRSFNDAAWEGFQNAEQELGVEIKVIEPQTVADYQSSITAVADSGYDFIMAVGNDWADTLNTVAPKYPEIKFAGVNIDGQGENIAVARFADHEGSFVVGAFAAMMSETGTVGFIGGVDVPAINRFYVGFEEGAKYANPDIEVLKTFVGSFNDPGKGKEFSLQLISQGADIIFHASGKTGEGLFEAVKDKDGVYAIGVDRDQDDIVPGKILTSMEKRLQVAAVDFIKSVKEESFKSGVKVYGITEGGVGLSKMQHTKDLVPQDVMDKIEDIKEKITSGEIKVTDIFNQ